MDLPNTVTEYDKEVFLATLLRKYPTLPILYNDPDWFYDECSFWFRQHKFAYTKMWEAMESEYKPLENYNRHHDETRTPGVTDIETHSESDTVKHTGKDITTPSGITKVEHKGDDTLERLGIAKTDTDTLAKSTLTTTSTVSADNTNTYQPAQQVTEQRSYEPNTPDNVHTEVSHQDDKDKQNYNSSIETSYVDVKTELEHGEEVKTEFGHKITNTHSGFDKLVIDDTGNIGVTTSQQMLESEVLLRHKIDMYDVMTIDFASEMLNRVW